MATRKRNEWLEAEESDEDNEHGYDSEDESRARMLGPSKRQKVEHEDSADDDDDEEDDNNIDNKVHTEDEQSEEAEEDQQHAAYYSNPPNHHHHDPKAAELAHLEKLAANLPSSLKLQTNQQPLPLASAPKKDKSGVVYISRVPPFMKPSVLRSQLTPYGAIGRIFLTPEPSTSRAQRLRNGGTRRKLFLDGWVEFVKKRDAKFVAENLNAQTMGGKKRGRWHDEVWNIRYLKGVKWSHLVEQIQNENAERAARLRFEIAQGKKENARFLENLEMGKMIGGIEAKKNMKGVDGDGGGQGGYDDDGDGYQEDGSRGVDEEPVKKSKAKARRQFKQNEVKPKAEKRAEPGQDVQRVLSKMF